MVASLSACSDKPTHKTNENQAAINQGPQAENISKKSEEFQAALSHLIPSPFVINDQIQSMDSWELTIGDEKKWDEIELSKLLIGLANLIGRDPVLFSKLVVHATSLDGSLYTAEMSVSDVVSFAKGQFSAPEFLRRVNLQKNETLASIRGKLQESITHPEKLPDSLLLAEEWLRREPDNKDALLLTANLMIRSGKYWDSLELLKKGSSFFEGDKNFNYTLAFNLEKLGMLPDAIGLYEKIVSLDPADFQMVKQLAENYRRLSQADKAFEVIKKAASLKEDAELYLIEGNIFRDQKKIKEATDSYTKGQKLAPDDSRFLYNLLLLDLDAKKIDLARKKLDDLKVKNPLMASSLESLPIFNPAKESDDTVVPTGDWGDNILDHNKGE